MGSLSEEARQFVLEWLGHAKPKPEEKPRSPYRDTWVVITLKNGNQIGGKVEYTSVREGGSDVCLSSVYEVTSTGDWKPSEWRKVEGTQCVIIGAYEYRYVQFLDEPPVKEEE